MTLADTKTLKFPLNPKDFPSWHEYYWTYQYLLADRFHLPLLAKWGVQLRDAKVLDVGCGDGGFTAAMADRGARCIGVEIKEFRRKTSGHDRLRYVVQDVTAPDASTTLGSDFDLIVLRDVIEHIPLARKKAFVASLKSLLRPRGRIFFTFPPYYSPYGLHQQTLLRSRLRVVPYLHYAPWFLLRQLTSWMAEPVTSLPAIEDIARCKMTMRHFRRLMQETELQIIREKHYLVRPSHEIRYGWKARTAWFGGTPLVQEVLVSGATILVADSRERAE